MKTFLLGLLIGLCLIPVGAFFYFRSGRAPVATSAPPMPLEAFLAKTALHAALGREAPKQTPSQPTTADLVTGAQVYAQDCAFCHGLAQQTATAASRGMFPRPPQLFDPDGMVTDDPVGVTYWKVKNGIRMTGMPSFAALFTERQMWQVAALLAKADKLPPEVVEKLKAPLFPLPPAEAGAPPAAGSKSKTR
jgi:thiosulfate dehydrogenase